MKVTCARSHTQLSTHCHRFTVAMPRRVVGFNRSVHQADKITKLLSVNIENYLKTTRIWGFWAAAAVFLMALFKLLVAIWRSCIERSVDKKGV